MPDPQQTTWLVTRPFGEVLGAYPSEEEARASLAALGIGGPDYFNHAVDPDFQWEACDPEGRTLGYITQLPSALVWADDSSAAGGYAQERGSSNPSAEAVEQAKWKAADPWSDDPDEVRRAFLLLSDAVLDFQAFLGWAVVTAAPDVQSAWQFVLDRAARPSDD